MAIEIGSRYFYRGRTYVARERELRPDKGLVKNPTTGRYEPEYYICLSPEERAEDRPHATDWVPEANVDRHYTLVVGEGVSEVTKPRRIQDQAADEARASVKTRAGVTPKKRLQNRITSTRYKLKHPEKNGRSEWSGHEIAEMERAIAETQAELAAL
jgi:hypothetical protein